MLARKKVAERRAQRLHVGVDLFLHVAGKESQVLAGLHGRARQDDALDTTRKIHRDGNGNREIGLSGARRADPEDHVLLEQLTDIVCLGSCSGLDRFPAGLNLERSMYSRAC